MGNSQPVIRKTASSHPVQLDSSVKSALAALSVAQPLLGKESGKASYLGRMVVELWEPHDATQSDGLFFAFFPALSAGTRGTAQPGSSDKMQLVKLIANKLNNRHDRPD